MQVAVGRLHLSVSMAQPIEAPVTEAEIISRPDALEHAHRQNQLQNQVETDRARVAADVALTDARRF